MTLEQLMASHRGEWQGDRAVVQDQGGYYWIVAERRAGKVEVTKDGERFGLGRRGGSAEVAPTAALEAALSGVGVVATKPARGRHSAAKLTADDLDLDG